MKIALDTDGTSVGFMRALDRILSYDGVQGLLVFSCDNNGFTPRGLDPLLAQIPVPVFGGCFPAILHKDQVYERGTVVVGLPVKPEVQLIEGLSDGRDNFDDAIDIPRVSSFNDGTTFILVDGMSLHVNSLLESVFNVLGLAYRYLGGGAASLELKPKPSLITNAGLKQDCAILAHVALSSGIGIAHGMYSVDGPHKVTGASFNTITTIDWQPAAKFYRDIISKHPDHDTNMPGIFGTDVHYSIGLNRYDAERVILDPCWEGQNSSIVFMKEVREGEFVDIMRVTEDSMIQSAASALNQALDDFGDDRKAQTVISFDCFSRKLFLDDHFNKELTAICSAGITHVGALTCGGEIGNSGQDFLDYHNRTCVLGVFGE